MSLAPSPAQSKRGAAVFVEVLRLTVVLVGATTGLGLGAGIDGGGGRVLGAVVGVLVGYVAGGVAGRFVAREVRRADSSLLEVPAIEVLSGALLGGLGFILGALACLPIFIFARGTFDYPAAAAVAWTAGALGLRLGRTNGRRLAEAARITRQLAPFQQAPEGAVMVDSSAVMDRCLLVLGRAGLLGRELLLPQVVADELRSLADGPDPVASRRAQRGLEALQALGEAGVVVSLVPGELAGLALREEKVLQLASELGARLVTCSAEVARAAGRTGLPVVDLRALASDLSPDHVPGEHLRIDLVRAGRQENQAVGYLPEGEMVVVNGAEHLVGSSAVDVVVLSSRPTGQGTLLFAQLAEAGGQLAAG